MELRVIKGMVEPSLLYQLLVVALLNDGTVFDHQNSICVLDGGKSMGDDKAGLVFHECAHRFLYLYLGA